MKSKSIIQIRSHAQKYFLKIEKLGAGEKVPPPRPKKKASRPYPHKAVKPPPPPKPASPPKVGPVESTGGDGLRSAALKKPSQKQEVSQSNNNNNISASDDGNKKATPKKEKKESSKPKKTTTKKNAKKTTTLQKSAMLGHLGSELPADDLFRSDDQLAGMIDNEVEEGGNHNDDDDVDDNNREIMNSNDASGGGSAEDDTNRLVDSNNGTATTSYKETVGHNKELMMTATNFINNAMNNNISDEDDNSGGSKSNPHKFMTHEYITQQMSEMQEQVRNSLIGATHEGQKGGTKRKAPNTPTSKGTNKKKSVGSGGPSRLGVFPQHQQNTNLSAHGSNLGGAGQQANDQLQHSAWNPTRNNSLTDAQRKKENQNTPNFQVVYSAFARMLENEGMSSQEAAENLQNMRPIDRETTVLLVDNLKKNLLSKRMWEDQMQLVASGHQTFLNASSNARVEKKQAKLVEGVVNSMKFNNESAREATAAMLMSDALVPPSPATQQTQPQPLMHMTKRDSDGTLEEGNIGYENNVTNTDSGNNDSGNERKGSDGGSGGTGQSQQTFVDVGGGKKQQNEQVKDNAAEAVAAATAAAK